MLDPRRTNGIVETIAVALSYELLDRIADKWTMVVPFAYMRGYGENFRKYRIQDEGDRLARLSEIGAAVGKRDWPTVRQYLYKHRAEQDQTSQTEIASEHGRDIEALGAMALRGSASVPWKSFIGLSVACTDVPLSRQKTTQPPSAFLPKCLPRLSGALCPVGRGCPGLTP